MLKTLFSYPSITLTSTLFAYFLTRSLIFASLGYALMSWIMPGGYVFGALFRMFCYHMEHPYQYIAIVSFVYACLATPGAMAYSRTTGIHKFIIIIGIMLLTIPIASIPGGILWEIHDMQAGYFPKGEIFWRHLYRGITMGFEAGWLVIALSIPYNFCGIVVGYAVTNNGFKMAANGHVHLFLRAKTESTSTAS